MSTDQESDPADLAGSVSTKDGRILPFDEWYMERFGEEPTRHNIQARLAKAKETP